MLMPLSKFLVGVLLIASSLYAKPRKRHSPQLVMPKNVGMFSLVQRNYATQTTEYDSQGQIRYIGDRFNKDLNASEIAAEGSELERLVNELNQYSADAQVGNNLGDSLYLGRLTADVQGGLDVSIFQTAWGFTRHITGFLAIPYIKAETNTELYIEGQNNAQQIKNQLGDLAYQEIRAGLDRVSQAGVEEIKASIEDKGYKPLGRWENQGVGDIRVGGLYGDFKTFSKVTSYEYATMTTLIAPTGYQDDPSILTDIGTGKGYYSLGLGLLQRFNYGNLIVGAETQYYRNFDTTVEKRVPEKQDALVSIERQTDVTYDPGDDYEAKALLGYKIPNWEAYYSPGVARHFGDQYSGALDGNYEMLSQNTDRYQYFHEWKFVFETVSLYQRKKFIYPMRLTLLRHLPIEARNTFNDNYWQLELMGFFGKPKKSRR